MGKDIDTTILLRLLEKSPGYISGSALAKELGCSRVNIWAHLEKLTQEGFEFRAVRNRGYCLLKEPDTIHKNLLEAYMRRKGVSSKLHYLPVVDSTMTEAERELAAGCEDGLVIVASKMTQGRGRRGRSWLGEDLGNLALTFAFRPDISLEKMQKFTLWMGVSLCEVLNKTYGLLVQVKWPNDLLFEGRKCGGVLAEARIQGDRTRDLVLGIGVNVNSALKQWPEELQEKATSLEVAAGRRLNMNAVAADLIAAVLNAYKSFSEGTYLQDFEEAWLRYECLHGATVRAQTENEIFEGRVAGLNPQGALILRQESGKEISLEAAEVSLTGNYKGLAK